MRSSTPFLIVLATCFWAERATAQVVREQGTKTVAGLLSREQPLMSWRFDARAGDILFASLDAEIYLTMPGHEGEMTAAAGDCEGEGGPGRFFIAVFDGDGVEVCRAERPAPPPGWQRDPRLACILPAPEFGRPGRFTVQVGLKRQEDSERFSGVFPFLLDFSLRSVAPDGVTLREAVLRSRNQL